MGWGIISFKTTSTLRRVVVVDVVDVVVVDVVLVVDVEDVVDVVVVVVVTKQRLNICMRLFLVSET